MGRGFAAWLCLVLACGLTACGDDDDSGSSKPHGMKDAGGGSHHEDAGDSTDAATDAASGDAAMMIVDAGPPPAADLDELIGLGIADYLGKAKPTKHETITGQAGVAEGSVVYDFDEKDGPVCFRGAPYNASILDQGSDNLMIYMQGGGACLSLICQATTEATPRGVPKLGVLDTTDDDNPVGSWNILYVPYCDGSVFGGDLDYVNPDDDTDVRKHHGVKNFSAALDLAIEHFPHPKKVLLTGSSAGGWGTIYHRALVRHVYPDAQISVFDDAGIGFSVNSDYVSSEWGSAKRSRPPSCKECQTDANLSQYVKYLLEHDPGTVVGDFSAWEDSVIMQFTFTSNPQTFRMHLQDATDIPAKAYPDRYKRFFINGSMHTTLLNAFHTTKVGDVNVSDWLGMMIDRDPKWKDEIE